MVPIYTIWYLSTLYGTYIPYMVPYMIGVPVPYVGRAGRGKGGRERERKRARGRSLYKDAIDPRGLCGAAVQLRKAAVKAAATPLFSYAPLGDFESEPD